jgi:histidinol-phosphate aminotransferase
MYGMAGLRVGYAVGQQPDLARLADYALPMSIGTIGLHAVQAALGDSGFESRERARNAEVRAFTVKRLEALGAKVPVSHANFLMADIGRDTIAFRDACRARGVAVGRPFPPLTTHSRISIGTMAEMQQACDVFASVLRA